MILHKRSFKIISFSLLLLAAMWFALHIGVMQIPHRIMLNLLGAKLGICELADTASGFQTTFWILRFPRVLMALLAGAALALCGNVFQAIFRNPLCDPYILGISSGASLGAAIAFVLGWNTLIFGITAPALLTALLTLFLIIGITRLSRSHSTSTLLLAGIAVNFFISALITLLMVMNQESMQQIIFWTMGSLANAGWNDVLGLSIALILMGSLLFYFNKDLNIIQLGNNTAKNLGVDADKTIFLLLGIASLLTAVVVSLCGVIGFVGLITPHAIRLLLGNDLRKNFFPTLFAGAVFLLIADTLARTVALPAELPVGCITALVGGPYFIWLLCTKMRKTKNA